MHIDLVGRIRNTKLPAKHGLMPVFEAIVNSIHAIEERGNADGVVRILIERDGQTTLGDDAHGNTLARVLNFVVEDNGAGFTDANYQSFETADSLAKKDKGGKGIGRITWLKAFSHAVIDSTYEENGTWHSRHFEFRPTNRGIEAPNLQRVHASAGKQKQLTRVTLVSFKENFREATPKSGEAIAARIVEHCLEYFLLGQSPRIIVEDSEEGGIYDLRQMFERDYKRASTQREVPLGEGVAPLQLVDLLCRATGDSKHALHFCANNRVVETVQLTGRIPHLDGPITMPDGGGERVYYSAYVSSALLDQRVNSERTGFQFDREGSFAFEDGPSWERVCDAAVSAVSEYLAPLTSEMKKEAVQRVRAFVETQAPRYRPLLEHRTAEIEKLSATLSESAFDLELHRLLSGWRHDVRRDAQERLRQVEREPSSFSQHKQAYVKVLGELQEVQKSDLAEYVVHRATVLTFFEALLGKQDDGRFSREDALHELVFPQRKTSDDVDYNEHNLWVLDERLAYHRFLASDIPFNQQPAPVDVASDDRPDLLIYNNPFALTSGSDFGSIVVVEFKRPERTDLRDDKSPIKQALRYVERIRAGQAKRADGSTINVPAHTPFFCYVVATLTQNLREDARERGFTQAPDGHGYFQFNQNYHAYIEVSDYRKVLDDAKKRNRAFFERLDIDVR